MKTTTRKTYFLEIKTKFCELNQRVAKGLEAYNSYATKRQIRAYLNIIPTLHLVFSSENVPIYSVSLGDPSQLNYYCMARDSISIIWHRTSQSLSCPSLPLDNPSSKSELTLCCSTPIY